MEGEKRQLVRLAPGTRAQVQAPLGFTGTVARRDTDVTVGTGAAGQLHRAVSGESRACSSRSGSAGQVNIEILPPFLRQH